ncbi:MAG TPA: M20/M25/M40 family metallo-hydrolase [Gemmatimonadales bacterium]|jgi:putative aminopeptidase FrvX|nr:M20/M25/M40 family metallo-hydrolase [Gemmatimonadales bacterium]
MSRPTVPGPLALLALLALAVIPTSPLAGQGIPVDEAQTVLRTLVETYGPSGAEGPVRNAVKQLLPKGLHTETDSAGSLWVRFGGDGPATVFVAHMDEIGWRVKEIMADGTLTLERLGGFFPSLYEGQLALVHTAKGPVPAVFMPRDSVGRNPDRTPGALRVDPGTGAAAGTRALGIAVGNTITMPKSYQRLAGTRATGRSFDDRVGCTALILAARRLAQDPPEHPVILIWSVREEIGLEGAAVSADALRSNVKTVHAVDTFVSADAPLELAGYGVAPLGAGAVIRAVDNSNVAPSTLVDSVIALAKRKNISLQYGATSGGNDGSVFAPWGVPDVPLAWPLRYSHSPAEVTDLKDVAALGELVEAVARAW